MRSGLSRPRNRPTVCSSILAIAVPAHSAGYACSSIGRLTERAAMYHCREGQRDQQASTRVRSPALRKMIRDDRNRRRRFRLFVALLVAAFLGAAALFWLSPFPREDRRLDYFASMLVSLRNLAAAESSYYHEHRRFTNALDTLQYVAVPGVRVAVVRADAEVWEAVVTHERLPTRCTYGDSASMGPVPSYRAFRKFCVNAP